MFGLLFIAVVGVLGVAGAYVGYAALTYDFDEHDGHTHGRAGL